jgi:hypothetical protein
MVLPHFMGVGTTSARLTMTSCWTPSQPLPLPWELDRFWPQDILYHGLILKMHVLYLYLARYYKHAPSLFFFSTPPWMWEGHPSCAVSSIRSQGKCSVHLLQWRRGSGCMYPIRRWPQGISGTILRSIPCVGLLCAPPTNFERCFPCRVWSVRGKVRQC